MIRAKETTQGTDIDPRAKRLIQAREYAKFGSASAAAGHHHWTASTYRSHENGTRGFGVDDAYKYAQAFGVSHDWLFYGRGKMLDDGPQGGDNVPDLRQSAIVHSPNVLPQREHVVFPTRKLPVYGLAKGGLEGALLLDTDPIDQVDCLPGLEFVPDAYAVYVIGDSMVPRYRSGETVYVHPTKPARKGDFVVVQIQEDGDPAIGYVKELVGFIEGQLVLSQYNPPQQLIFPQNLVRAIHKIVGTKTD